MPGSLFCPSTSSLFLRANGDFVCWDDAGSDTVLQDYSTENDIAAVRRPEGPCHFNAVNLRQGRLPRPEVCPGCICLSKGPGPVFDPHLVDVMQVEASARCDLRCLACASPEERGRLRPPLDLAPDMFRRVLEDLISAGIGVSNFDFSGHGEPLQNPGIWELVSLTKEYYPGSFAVMLTNGHGAPGDEVLLSGLDEVQVAIDGVDQETYDQYRVGGDFSRAWDFLSGLAGRARDRHRPRVVWRYILFEHNDSEEDLRRVWTMAVDAGIDEVRFIFTSMGRWSRKIMEAGDLRSRLLETGVPAGNIRLDSSSFHRRVRVLSELLRRLPAMHRLARRAWRKRRKHLSSGTDRPVITSDYCRIDTGVMKGILELSLRHLSGGRPQDAAPLLLHVERLAELPGRHNPDYDPEETLALLGRTYRLLRARLHGGTVPS